MKLNKLRALIKRKVAPFIPQLIHDALAELNTTQFVLMIFTAVIGAGAFFVTLTILHVIFGG